MQTMSENASSSTGCHFMPSLPTVAMPCWVANKGASVAAQGVLIIMVTKQTQRLDSCTPPGGWARTVPVQRKIGGWHPPGQAKGSFPSRLHKANRRANNVEGISMLGDCNVWSVICWDAGNHSPAYEEMPMKSTVSYSSMIACLLNSWSTFFMASGRRVRYRLGSTKSIRTHAHCSGRQTRQRQCEHGRCTTAVEDALAAHNPLEVLLLHRGGCKHQAAVEEAHQLVEVGRDANLQVGHKQVGIIPACHNVSLDACSDLGPGLRLPDNGCTHLSCIASMHRGQLVALEVPRR